MLKRIVFSFLILISFASSALAGDPFIVSGVYVDATGDNAIEAQNKAVSEGQMRAAQILLNRLTLPTQRNGQTFRTWNLM